jgi:hypothetical protein
MSSIKRPRLTLAASDNTYVTPLNITNPMIVPGEQAAVNLLPHTPESTEIAPLSLMTLPVDVFILFTPYLAAQDILRLSHTGRYFHELLSSVSLYGSSVLDRNKALLQCGNPYDESTQTLDLSHILRQKKKPSLRQYEQYLQKITALLVNYRNWAKACIKIFIFPIEAMLKWELTGSLSKITPLLSGLTHLHLFLPAPAARSRIPQLTNDQRKIFYYI